MRVLNDNKGEINGDVRFVSFQDVDIIVIALNALQEEECKNSYAEYRKKRAALLSKQLLSVADALADKYAENTYNKEQKV